jgi:3-oxoacyl-[acyl-carrier protein] reductase
VTLSLERRVEKIDRLRPRCARTGTVELGLHGRACILTGASRGIGAAIAEHLAGEGASLLLIGRDRDRLAAVADRCRGTGAAAEPLVLDVTSADAGDRAVAVCRERFGRLDVLVNNAGTSAVKALEELTDADWEEQWQLCVMAPMRLMRAAAPVMAQAGWGRIVNVSSSSGKRPGQRNIAYSVGKAAELSLSRAFAERFAADGVLVNAITPGPVASELWLEAGGMAEQTAHAQGITREQALAKAAAGVPLGRLGEVGEIAAVVAFLCSEAASFVTGAAWSTDGGAVPGII